MRMIILDSQFLFLGGLFSLGGMEGSLMGLNRCVFVLGWVWAVGFSWSRSLPQDYQAPHWCRLWVGLRCMWFFWVYLLRGLFCTDF